MAIVSDQFDPSGMFSKAGRVSLEMFQIIQQKNEILFNKKKFFKPKLTSFGLYDLVYLIFFYDFFSFEFLIISHKSMQIIKRIR